MKNHLPPLRPVLLAGVVLTSASAALSYAQDILTAAPESGWFVRADAAARFNVKATVRSLSPATPAPFGIYDDGSVQPDIGGTASGLTWNWSYQSPSQVLYDINNQPQAIQYHRIDNAPNIGSQEVNPGSPLIEGEFVGGYRLEPWIVGNRKARLSFEIGTGYFSFSEGINVNSPGFATLTVRSYGLGGILPPVPPYAGTFNGPGPLLDLNPDPAGSSTNLFATTTAFDGTLKASFYNFRFGPAFSIDLSRRLNLQFGAGWDSLYADATLQYLETSVLSPHPTTVSLTKTQWRPGVYVELLANFQVIKHLSAFLGGDFRYNKDLTFSDAAHEVTLQLGSTYAAKAGLSFSF